MKIRNTESRAHEKIELQMTPMIDIVFQLLVFFVMTFKIVAQEGDFNVKMPLSAPSQGLPDDQPLPPMKLRLTANAEGQLTGVRLNEQAFDEDPFGNLHQHIIAIIGDERGPGSIQDTAEIELDCDYQLRYEYVVQAITAVSGYLTDDGQVIKLVEKIKFSPPKSNPVVDGNKS